MLSLIRGYKLSAILKRWPTVYFYRQTTGIVVYISLLWGRLLAPVSAPTNKEEKMKKQAMFENYPDVVEVDDLRKMLGGISKKLAYRLLSDQEIRSVRVGRAYKIPKICVIEYLLGEEMCHISLS